MRTRKVIAVVAVGCAFAAPALVAAAPANAAPARHPLANTAPRWEAQAQHLGHAATSAAVSARVYLTPRGGLAALGRLATSLSTPGSADYAHFLTAAQYAQRFAPTSADVASVSSWLRSTGLSVTGTGAGNRYVSVSGTVAAAQRAFGITIDSFRRGTDAVQAPTSDVSVPSTVAGSVLAIDGLDTSPSSVHPDAKLPAGFRNARPCSTYFGQIKATYQADFTTPLPAFNGATLPYAPCGYTGPQLRAAYEGGTTLDGTGVTVAITDAYAAPTIAADANTYAVSHGDGAYAAGQLTQTNSRSFTHQKECDPTGWYGEETLDVEAVHAMAPGAKIHYYGAASCNDADLLDALARVVDDGTAQVVTNSWGDVESNETAANVNAYESVFLQGAVEGMSFLFSSGDNGDELANTGIKQADYPTSDPYVTSVGGTSTAIGRTGALSYQTGWGTVKYSLSASGTSWSPVGFLYGSGGGTSSLFNQPAYQAGIAPGPKRTVPDVAMDADPNTGFLIGETQAFPNGNYYDEYRIGGTSLASPLFAGMTALTVQHAGHGAGLLNPVVYSHIADFLDVKGTPKDQGVVRVDYVDGVDASAGLAYSVRTFNQDSSLTIGRGWDDVTGVGSPAPGWLTALG